MIPGTLFILIYAGSAKMVGYGRNRTSCLKGGLLQSPDATTLSLVSQPINLAAPSFFE